MLDTQPPRLQPTNQATTCHHQLPNTSFLGPKRWYQVVGNNFLTQKRVVSSSWEQLGSPKPTNQPPRMSNKPTKPTTNHRPTNKPTNRQPQTNNQQSTTTNHQSINPPIPKIPKLKNQEPKLRWPGGMCGVPKSGGGRRPRRRVRLGA